MAVYIYLIYLTEKKVDPVFMSLEVLRTAVSYKFFALCILSNYFSTFKYYLLV